MNIITAIKSLKRGLLPAQGNESCIQTFRPESLKEKDTDIDARKILQTGAQTVHILSHLRLTDHGTWTVDCYISGIMRTKIKIVSSISEKKWRIVIEPTPGTDCSNAIMFKNCLQNIIRIRCN
jgi:hypothetical protein